MVDLLRKEQICILKVKALAMLNQVIDDELYSKKMLIRDLTNLLVFLDQMEDEVLPVVLEE
ncbi:hypothetical protein ACSU6B_22695 [Neobacillus sp. C211]|uniref:hypothetical protein n=1 Tax=unclassified Neobacillus TaxID=2675272 RepID=UPI003978E081